MIFSIVAPAALVATFMVKSEIVAAGSIKNNDVRYMLSFFDVTKLISTNENL